MTGGTHLLRTDVQSTLIEDGPTCRGPGAGSYGHAGAGHAARFSGWGRTLAPRPVGERGAPEEPPGPRSETACGRGNDPATDVYDVCLPASALCQYG